MSDLGLPPLYTADQAAQWLGKSAEDVHGLVDDGRISYLKLGPDPAQRRFTLADVRAYLETLRVRNKLVPNSPEYDRETGMVRGLWGCYHNVNVGPCTAEMEETEVDCGPVTRVHAEDADFFDCTYAEWARLLRDETRAFAATGVPLPTPGSASPRDATWNATRGRTGRPAAGEDEELGVRPRARSSRACSITMQARCASRSAAQRMTLVTWLSPNRQ